MQTDPQQKALVLLSGGQDSTTCLYWALDKFSAANVETVTFDYGQRHRIELECASKIATMAAVTNTMLPINTFAALGGNSLTDTKMAVKETTEQEGGLPNTFVQGRNLIFTTFAAALAYSKKIGNLIIGVAQTDYSGYPDCRHETMLALQKSLNLGMESEFELHTPLMFKSKKETVIMALELGAMPALAQSHTCYNGSQPPCSLCAACQLRAKGFLDAGISDPLLTRFANSDHC